MAPEEAGKQKHIKAVTLSRQERIVLAEEKTRERLLVTDFFKDVLTAAVNANSKGFLQQLVLALNGNNSDKVMEILRVAKGSGGITLDAAVDADKIIEHFRGAPPQPDGLPTEEFCQKALAYLEWKKNNDEIVLQLFRDAYVHDRGLKKGILLEVSMQAGALLAEQEKALAKQPKPDPSRSLSAYIQENLRMATEIEQDKLEEIKLMMKVFWADLSSDSPETELYKRIEGQTAKLMKDSVLYWNGYLGVVPVDGNREKPLWYDFRLKDHTSTVNAQREKETEKLMADLHSGGLDHLLEEPEEATEAPAEAATPDDSKAYYGAAHKVSSREPIRLQEGTKMADLKVRLTFEAPKPEGRKAKVDTYAFIYPILPDHNDAANPQVLGFNEFLVASFYDDRSQAYIHYLIRTRKELEQIQRTYRTYLLEKVRVCEFDAALKAALPPAIQRDARVMVMERMKSFLAQNRAKAPSVLAAIKAQDANGTVQGLVEYFRSRPSPDGLFAYDLWQCLKKVLAAKAQIIPARQELAAQSDIQNKLVIQTQNEIKTNQTAQRIMGFKAKLAAQVKVTMQAKKNLEQYVGPLIEMVNKAYLERRLQPKPPVKNPIPPPKPPAVGPPPFPWETVTPWEKMRQLVETLAAKAAAELPGIKMDPKLPDWDKSITDKNLEDILTFLHDFTVKSVKDQADQMGMVIAETLSDYIHSLDPEARQHLLGALARQADELKLT